MVNKLYEECDIQNIADAIRAQNGTSATYKVADMASAVCAITGGGEPLVTFSQMNPIVTQYMADVTYSPDDYSTSQMLPYVYTETEYDKGKPTGHNVTVSQGGELHLADDETVCKMPSVAGVNTLYNAVPNKVTHFWNTVSDNVTESGTIKPTGQVRMIQTTANNVRDLGGWACDGGTIRYGKLFRGGLLSESDRAVLVNQCKIRHDLDLRGKGDNGGLTASPLGEDVAYTVTNQYVWYSLKNEDDWRTILGTIFDAAQKNEPLMFHCAAGADRTGTVACIVEAILGVGQADIDKDFELTSFAIYPNARRRTDDDWKALITEIHAIPVGDTFRDKVINWVGYLGFTADDINAFRGVMIDGTPDTVTVEEYAPTEPEVNYFNADTASLNYRIGSSGSLSAYNGMVTTDFIEIDATMEEKFFAVSGITPVLNTAYSYYARTSFYDANKNPIADAQLSYQEWYDGVWAWSNKVTSYPAYIRISLVIKDNAAITAEDVANIKITLE